MRVLNKVKYIWQYNSILQIEDFLDVQENLQKLLHENMNRKYQNTLFSIHSFFIIAFLSKFKKFQDKEWNLKQMNILDCK